MIKGITYLAQVWSWLAVAITWGAVFLLLAFLGLRGLDTLNLALLFGKTPPWQAITGALPVWHGIWPACAGTVALVLLSSLLAIPVGLASGIYLAQYAGGPWKKWFSLAVELLAGIPSIVMGLFGFALILFLRKTLAPQANTCLLLSAVCLALLVLPYLILLTQTALEAIPADLKVVGLSLGFTPWQNLVQVLLPLAARGILSGVILAVGRAAEDTAVIMLTGVVANAGMPAGILDKYEALPFNIFYLAAEARSEAELAQGFGAALILLILTGALFLGAYYLQSTLSTAWDRKKLAL
ncbi:MAG: ABC transporter permease subunit [Syntrophales bacterium]|nr:ABC transporter permease subunit [Syntrophales bacterium]